MKYLVMLCLLASLTISSSNAQKPTEKTVKLKQVNYPVIPVRDVKSYKVVIHNGSIPIELSALNEKKGVTSKLQAWQDDINKKNPEYYSYTSFVLDPVNPDVIVELCFGGFIALGRETKEHKIPCVIKGQKISKETVRECPAYYYEFKYKLPYLVRISDKTGKILLNELQTGEGTQFFGYDGSGMSGYLKLQELETAYGNANQNRKAHIAEKAMISKIEESEAMIQKAFYFLKLTEKIDIASATGKEFDYAELNQAQALAIVAYENLSKGDEPGAKRDFEKALATWKKEVADLNMSNDNARINRKIAAALYRNLTYAYLHLWELDSAGAYLSEASRLSKLSGNLNRVEESVELSNLITERKTSLSSYRINKEIKGNPIKAENLLQKIRVKQKDASYNPLTNQDNYLAYTQSTPKKDEQSQAELLKNLLSSGGMGGSHNGSNGKSKYEDRVQKTSFQGYLLMINAFMDGKMDSLPQEICSITYLNELNISNNSLKYIPSDIGKMKDLKKLHLNNNHLTSLPAEISKLENLKMLNLKGNAIPKEQIDMIQKALPDCKIKY